MSLSSFLCMLISNCLGTTCWKIYSFCIELPWHVCRKSIDHIIMGYFWMGSFVPLIYMPIPSPMQVTSPKKKYGWKIGTWKYSQHHYLLRKPKSTMCYYYTSARITKTRNIDDNSAGESMEHLELSNTAMQNRATTFKKNFEVSFKVQYLSIWPGTPTSSRETDAHVQTKRNPVREFLEQLYS